VVLVGKGITFDTGGLSMKPHEAMLNMKRDMTGGAVVMSVLAALADVGCPVKVVGLIPAAENSVDGNALRPGDVVRHHGGRTTEVTNTDAEGRLVLADAMAWAVENLEPDVLVDVSTLTGAVKVALGLEVGGLFANDDGLAETLLESAARTGEPLWRFPLASVYEERLSSKVADADNAPGGPGAIIAGLFLQHFAGGVPWAHLDLASTGDATADSHEYSKGPTGFGARLLLDWLGSADPLARVSRSGARS
jgi:leucyl aminopeptidase